MKRFAKQNILDKKKLLRQEDHLTRPPRLEGAMKEKMMLVRKEKKIKSSE
jgi:hypothetical protein